jgi:hypothetical protein
VANSMLLRASSLYTQVIRGLPTSSNQEHTRVQPTRVINMKATAMVLHPEKQLTQGPAARQSVCMQLQVHVQFGTKVLAAEACSAAMMQTYRNALILCL